MLNFLIMLCRVGIVVCAMLFSIIAARADEIGCVDTAWQLIGSNHKVCIYAFDDPAVSGVACHVSQARTGGLGGWIGMGEDPSRFSIACRQSCRPTRPTRCLHGKHVAILQENARVSHDRRQAQNPGLPRHLGQADRWQSPKLDLNRAHHALEGAQCKGS